MDHIHHPYTPYVVPVQTSVLGFAFQKIHVGIKSWCHECVVGLHESPYKFYSYVIHSKVEDHVHMNDKP